MAVSDQNQTLIPKSVDTFIDTAQQRSW